MRCTEAYVGNNNFSKVNISPKKVASFESYETDIEGVNGVQNRVRKGKSPVEANVIKSRGTVELNRNCEAYVFNC